MIKNLSVIVAALLVGFGVVYAVNDQITDSVTVAEPETKHQPVYKHQPEIPQILSYRNKFKNEREKKYKK